MTQTFVLAHLSDVHLAPVPWFGPRHWRLKRLMGLMNWMLKRRFQHRREIVEALVADLHGQEVDHIAVTGDLANLGLPREHKRALRWLEGVGSPSHVSVIPGNHDIYTRIGNDPGVARWAAYMVPFEAPDVTYAAVPFPYVRRFGQVAVIGVNSSEVTAPGNASGIVDEGQLDRLRLCLEELGAEHVFRIVLIHHPPLPGQSLPLRNLRNSEAFADLLSTAGAELVLHGHDHRNTLAWQPITNGAGRSSGQIPVIGVASASYAGQLTDEMDARYNLFKITIGDGKRSIEMIGRKYDTTDGTVDEAMRTMLIPPQDTQPGVEKPATARST